MTFENRIKRAFREYLDVHGYVLSDSNLLELVDIYLDCQEWDDKNPLTGMTEIEMLDWIRHTSEVSRIIAVSESSTFVQRMILAYMEISRTLHGRTQKELLEIDIAN